MNYRQQSKNPSCQLIEIINAGIYLGLGDVSDERFLEMEKEGCCFDDGCINIYQFYDELGIKSITPNSNDRNSLKWIKENLPVGILTNVSCFHRSLIVDVEYDRLTIINHDLGNYKYGNATLSFGELLDLAIKPFVRKNGRITKKRIPRLQEIAYKIKTK